MCAYVVVKWASQLKTIMSDLRLRNGNFPFKNQKGCKLGLERLIITHACVAVGFASTCTGNRILETSAHSDKRPRH